MTSAFGVKARRIAKKEGTEERAKLAGHCHPELSYLIFLQVRTNILVHNTFTGLVCGS